jgi:small-conductance mechanosensitive channel
VTYNGALDTLSLSRTALYFDGMRDFMIHLEEQVAWLPDWIISLALIAGAVGVALVAHRALYNLLTRVVAAWDLFWRSLVSRTERPARFAIVVAALALAVSVAPLTDLQASVLRHGLLICFIALIAWMVKSAAHIWTTVYLRRFKLDAEDNLLARKHVTQSRIIGRIIDLLIIMIAVAAALMTFDAVRQYGVSLLASAGAAGIVVGLALQPVLKNLFAASSLLSPSRSASMTHCLLKASGAMSRRSPQPMSLSKSGTGGASFFRSATSSRTRSRTGPARAPR